MAGGDKAGYWISIRSGKTFEVNEHCSFAKSTAGATAMGLPERVQEEIAPYTCDFNGPDRKAVCIAVMKAGYIRMRGHGGGQYSFEFWGDSGPALDTIWMFCQNICGSYSQIVINNLKTNENFSSNYKDFNERMERDKSEVLRIAKQLLKNPALLTNPDVQP